MFFFFFFAIMAFVLDKMKKNIVEKGVDPGHQHFLLLHTMFSKALSLGSLKVGIVWIRAMVQFTKQVTVF